MLDVLSRYENLGTPQFFSELFNQLNAVSRGWTSNHVQEHFFNRIIDGNHVFDGCLPLAESIGAVVVSNDGFITLHPSLVPALVSESYLKNKFLEMVLISAKKDDLFHQIFCSDYISYDIIYRLIQIDVGAFRFRYANFRQLLLTFDFLFPHPDSNIKKYIVNSKYKKLFDRELMPEIKKRKLGIDELEKLLEQNHIHGEEAEIFVEEYERKRLVTHPDLRKIERISMYDTGAGYDIVSFDDLDSHETNRFIEVKSFSGVPNFFWSRNELDAARVKKGSYFLYLVDRDKMINPNYHPIIISDPCHRVINDDKTWTKRIEKYFINLNTSFESLNNSFELGVCSNESIDGQ